MQIIIGGAMGRMGRELAEAAEAKSVDVVGGVDVAYQGQPWAFPVVRSYAEITQKADVLVDFSRPDGLSALLTYCEAVGLPAILCATGYTSEEVAQIENAAKKLPILRSANMSLGVNVLEQLVTMAARALGDGFDIEIVEKHHRMKADAPSGTALMLYEAAATGEHDMVRPVFGRHGREARREKGDIGLHAVRGGTVTGEHEVGFYGDGEQVLLAHRAESRALFAQGALRAAGFLAGKPAGLYTMRDVVAEILK